MADVNSHFYGWRLPGARGGVGIVRADVIFITGPELVAEGLDRSD